MRTPILLLSLALLLFAGAALAAGAGADVRDVEVGCAKCVYHMDGVAGCKVAAKIGDEVMLLKDSGLDAHGLCSGPKRAKLHHPTVTATRVELHGDGEMAAMEAEIGCGKCIFHMEGVKGCKVAAKIGDDVMLVQGSGIDAHSICSESRSAKVTGTIEDGVLHIATVDLMD